MLKTFWANPSAHRGSSVASGSHDGSSDSASLAHCEAPFLDANERLVAWIVDVFVKDMKKIVSAGVGLSQLHSIMFQLTSAGFAYL